MTMQILQGHCDRQAGRQRHKRRGGKHPQFYKELVENCTLVQVKHVITQQKWRRGNELRKKDFVKESYSKLQIYYKLPKNTFSPHMRDTTNLNICGQFVLFLTLTMNEILRTVRCELVLSMNNKGWNISFLQLWLPFDNHNLKTSDCVLEICTIKQPKDKV